MSLFILFNKQFKKIQILEKYVIQFFLYVLERNLNWIQHHLKIFNAYQSNFSKNFFGKINLLYLFSYFQIFLASQKNRSESVFISKEFKLFSYDTFITNLSLFEIKYNNRTKDIYFDPDKSHIYLSECQIIKDWLSLFNNMQIRQRFIKYMLLKTELLAKLNAKIFEKDSKLLLLYIYYIECLNKFAKNCYNLPDRIIKNDKILLENNLTIQNKIDEKINRFIKKSKLNANKSLKLYNNINSYCNDEKMKTKNYFFDILFNLNSISVTHAFYILTYALVILEEIENIYLVENDLPNQENFFKNENVELFMLKTNLHYKLHDKKDFIKNINIFKKENSSSQNNIDLLNISFQKSAQLSISYQINSRLQLNHSIFIFLILVLEFVKYDYKQWAIFSNFNSNSQRMFDLEFLKKNLEFDLQNVLGLRLNVIFNYTSNDFSFEKFHKFYKLFPKSKKNTIYNLKIYFILFLISNKISFYIKDNSEYKNGFNLSNFLMNHITNILTEHIQDNRKKTEIKEKYKILIFYTVDWLRLLLSKNKHNCDKELDCEIEYYGLNFIQNQNFISYEYLSFSLDEFLYHASNFNDENDKKRGKFIFSLVSLYFVRLYFLKNNEVNVLKNIETIQKYIETWYSHKWPLINEFYFYK